MLITFQKSSPNREPNQNGELLSGEEEEEEGLYNSVKAFVHFFSCVYAPF